MDKVDLIWRFIKFISEILKRLINTFDVSEKLLLTHHTIFKIFELKLFKNLNQFMF